MNNLWKFLIFQLLIICLCVPTVRAESERILGGQIYVKPHRSSPVEFQQRKAWYQELIQLRYANRQAPYLTLNMKKYRAGVQTIWANAKEVYYGMVRSTPICGELIPAEHQEPLSKKQNYYQSEAIYHDNFCNYVRNHSYYSQLICQYFIVSQEIEDLQKPILDLAPETIYTMKNLEGRMEYLRERLPERTQVGKKIIQYEAHGN